MFMRSFLAFLLIILVGLPACRFTERTPEADQPRAESSSDQTIISFAAWNNEREVYQTLAERFMTEHPHIQVVIVSLDEIFEAALQADDRAPLEMLHHIVSSADTAPLEFHVTPAAYGTNLLRDLQPLIDADPDFQRADFYPGALERFSAEGGTWVLPRSFSLPILYYNKALFAQANLPEPASDWTWDDLLGAASQLARKRGDEVDIYGLAEPSQGLRPLLALLQEEEIDLARTPVEAWQFDQPGVATVMTRMRTLLASGAVGLSPIPPGMYDLDTPRWPQDWIIDGRVGLWASDQSWQVRYQSGDTQERITLDFPVGTVPYPATTASLFRGEADGYLISGGTAHPNEAWQWIEFLSRQPIDQMLFQDIMVDSRLQRIPARKSLAEETYFWERLDADERTTYEQALQNMADATTPVFTAHTISATFNSLYAALLNLVADETGNIDGELARAQTQLQAWLAEEGREPEPNLQPVVVATPPVEELLPDGTLVRFGVPTAQMGQMRQLVQTFQQQHPDITVQIVPLDTHAGVLDLTTAAQATDCFSWDRPPETEQELAALADLQPLIDADATFPRDDYMAALLSPYQRDGKLYGLPHAFAMRVLYYNRTAFQAAGLEPPTATWTPADFLTAAQALTQGDGPTKQYGYVPAGSGYSDLLFFINQFGADLTRGSGQDIRPNFADPEVVAAIQWYLDLYQVHQVMPEPALTSQPGSPSDTSIEAAAAAIRPEALLQSGHAGLWFDWSYGDIQFPYTMNADDTAPEEITGAAGTAPQLDSMQHSGLQPEVFEVDIAPLPVGAAGLTTGDITVRGFHISAEPQNPAACWTWISFLANDMSNLRNEIPARQSLMTAPEFAEQAPYAAALVELYDTALQQPSQPGTNASIFGTLDPYWFFQAIDAAIQGEQDLADGLAEAQATSLAYLECLNVRADADPATCAQQVDPLYQGRALEGRGSQP
jgi:ABC-type glycerol-3-phosphate transport system substrate-binding protein